MAPANRFAIICFTVDFTYKLQYSYFHTLQILLIVWWYPDSSLVSPPASQVSWKVGQSFLAWHSIYCLANGMFWKCSGRNQVLSQLITVLIMWNPPEIRRLRWHTIRALSVPLKVVHQLNVQKFQQKPISCHFSSFSFNKSQSAPDWIFSRESLRRSDFSALKETNAHKSIPGRGIVRWTITWLPTFLGSSSNLLST